ncbi:MAG: hypothetical protein KDN19_05190 [Verrucomicrobiae bacterium]|nr:hypothetical protein [Verrucomicrobiae bacterium]
MARSPLLLVFALLAALDTAAILVGIQQIGSSNLPPLPAAIGIHLLVVFIAIAAVRLYPGAKEQPGIGTLGLLAALLCLMSPVLGCLIGGWLVAGQPRPRELADPFAGIRLGNPLTGSPEPPSEESSLAAESLAKAAEEDNGSLSRLAPARLRERLDKSSIQALRSLRHRPDARTQLYAQGALSALFENREQALDRLRREAATVPEKTAEAFALRERLASALYETATSELHGDSESRSMIRDAADQYDRALAITPSDPACLYGKARCLIALDQLDQVPDLYGRLCAQAGAEYYADRLELAYFAAAGNWQRTTEAAARIDGDHRDGGLSGAQRDFWLNRTALPVT